MVQDVEWQVSTASFVGRQHAKPVVAKTEVLVFTSGNERRVFLAEAGTLTRATDLELEGMLERADWSAGS